MGHTLRIGLALIFGALCFGQVTVRSICSSGCQYTPTQIQNAVNDASPGDIITIDAATGASTSAGLTLPAKTNPYGLYVTIRSSNIYNLPANTRVSPTDPNLAVITYTTSNIGNVAMLSTPGASFYRFEGIKFEVYMGNASYSMIYFGSTSNTDHEVSALPHDIDFDRDAFMGYQGLGGPCRAITMNTGRVSITNSYFGEIKCNGQEAQAIGGWNTKGPFYFRNNHFEASSEATIFGGAQPNITGLRATDLQYIGNEYYKPWVWRLRGLTSYGDGQGQPPSGSGVCLYDSRGGEWWADTTSTLASGNSTLFNCVAGTWTAINEAAFSPWFQQTASHIATGSGAPSGACTATGYFYKDATNLNYYSCSGTGGSWTQITLGNWVNDTYSTWWEKNHFELKNASRVLAEGNYLHQAWLPAALNQHGACVLINQVDDSSNTVPPRGEPSAVISFVEFRYNICDSNPWGVSNAYIGKYFRPDTEINVHDNLFSNLGNEPQSRGDAEVIQLGAQGKYSFSYNTITSSQPSAGRVVDMAQPYTGFSQYQQIVFIGNIVPFMAFGFYDNTGHGDSYDAIDANWNLNRSFAKNVVVNQENISGQPAYNLFQASGNPPFSGQIPCASCANPAPTTFSSGIGFVNYAGGDYHLGASSPYAGWWAHGHPAGADIDQVNWSTAQALTGYPNPFLDFKIRSLAPARTSALIGYTSYDAAACTVTVSTRPDLASPILTVGDTGGDADRTMSITGLNPGTRYFYTLVCDGYKRSGQFLTNP